jgi:hypothetical protein
MKYMLALGVLPAALAAWVTKPAPAPIKPKLVQTEGITAARIDDASFSLRWRPVSELPPASVRHAFKGNMADSAGTEAEAPQPKAPSRRLRSRPARLDLCGRHGMRKIHYGKRWRCRR